MVHPTLQLLGMAMEHLYKEEVEQSVVNRVIRDADICQVLEKMTNKQYKEIFNINTNIKVQRKPWR